MKKRIPSYNDFLFENNSVKVDLTDGLETAIENNKLKGFTCKKIRGVGKEVKSYDIYQSKNKVGTMYIDQFDTWQLYVDKDISADDLIKAIK